MHLLQEKFVWMEKEVTFKDPKQAQQLGVSIIHQEFSLIPYLSGVDNIFRP